MAPYIAPSALIVGHSYVPNLRDAISEGELGFQFDFGLDVHARYLCSGGWRVPQARMQMESWQRSRGKSVDMVFLQVGGNDFRVGENDAVQVAKSVLELAEFVKDLFDVKFVFVGKFFGRGHSKWLPTDAAVAEYNKKVLDANEHCKTHADEYEVTFWRHKGIEDWERLIEKTGLT